MTRLDNCPHCDRSLRGARIPDDSLGPELRDGQPHFFMRTISVEVSAVYDGGLFYQCPDCGGRWHRWPEGDRLRAEAARFVGAP